MKNFYTRSFLSAILFASIIFADENHGYDVKILDVSDVSNISVLSTFNSGVNSQSMAHNGIIKGDNAYIPYYHDGIRVFDISDPSNPIQTWKYDTYAPLTHASYKGAWGVYPYLPSGNIIVSDMQTGLYIFNLNENPNTINQYVLETKIYPNPANKEIWIESNADNIIIYNLLGRIITREKIQSAKHVLSRNNFVEGIYFYELEKNNKKIKTGKIIFK